MFRWLDRLRVALRSIVHRRRIEDELNEEMAYHFERQVEEGVKAGQSLADARYAAIRTMGAIEKNKEECRDARPGQLIAQFVSDIRYAGRTQLRSPGFALLSIGIMALGIGANTAVFSVINAVLLKPLPYAGADRIVVLRTAFTTTGGSQTLVSIANFRDWRDQSSTFETMSSYRPGETSVSAGSAAEYVRTASVDSHFFKVFAIEPIIGRTFRPEEIGPDGPPYIVISHSYWQSRLGGDPRVLGQTIRIGDRSRTIIGVLPAGFQFPFQTDVWGPQTTRSTSRTGHNLFAVGRLKAGISLEQAQADLRTVAANLERQHPENKGRGVTPVPLQSELVGNVRLTLYLLWGVVGIVLLIACANTATLLLGRATTRTREVAVRAALGADRRRIIRQLITESLLLALTAGGAGLLLAFWGVRALLAVTTADVVRRSATDVDARVLAFTLAISIATSLLFGLLPAFHASRIDLIDALKQGGRAGAGRRTIRTRSLLVVSEVALAVVLLTAAGLLTKSLAALGNVQLGFQPNNVLVMKATGARSREEQNVYFDQLFSKVAVLPGVAAVGATSIPPGDFSYAGSGTHFIDAMPVQRDRTSEPATLLTIVAPGTFSALGIPLKSGRDFNANDVDDRPLVAIVNEALVRISLSGRNPIGRTIFCTFDRQDAMTIIGVVGDVRQANPAKEPVPECYMPYRQHAYNGNTLSVVIRTAGDPLALSGSVRRVATEVSPEVPVSFTTMDALVAEGVRDPRFRALLFGLFAGLAVCLAMAGVYGVMAYAVQQRSKEIGLRMVLGANRLMVLRLILGQGFGLAAAGVVVGLAGAAGANRVLETVLFQVRPFDIQVYVGVIGLVAIVTLLASYFPAWRAAVVNPVQVLKAE